MGSCGVFIKRKEDAVVEKIWYSILTSLNNIGYVGRMSVEVDGKDSIKSIEEVYRYENGRWLLRNNRIVCDMKEITAYEYPFSDESLFSGKYLMMYVPTQEVLGWDDSPMYEWMGRGDSLTGTFIIEDKFERGEMLLRFVEDYLRLNPNDIFYNEQDWYYTKDDIDKIIEKKVDPETWHCINPAEI